MTSHPSPLARRPAPGSPIARSCRRRWAAAVLAAATLAGCSSPADGPGDATGSVAPATTQPTTAPARTPTPSPTPPPSPTPTPAPAVADHGSAQALATDLVAAERAVRDPDTPAAHLAGWAHVQHAAYRELYHHRDEWLDPVAAAIPDDLRPAFDNNWLAQSELFALTDPRTELPNWTIVEPPPPEELLAAYRAAQEEFGVDWSYLAAIHFVETRFGRIQGDSHAGARGPMQFLPSTWDAYGEGDIEDPHDAIRAAARYLVAHGAPSSMHDALWAYNHSDRYVTAISAYAENLRREPELFGAYYRWRVYYRLVTGDVVLDQGWTNPQA